MRVHPLTGERGLFIGGFARRIVGLSQDESRDILRLLQSYVTRPEHMCCAGAGRKTSWCSSTTGSRSTTRVDNYDDLPRRLHRVTVAGDIPTGVDGGRSYSIKGDASEYSEVVEVPTAA